MSTDDKARVVTMERADEALKKVRKTMVEEIGAWIAEGANTLEISGGVMWITENMTADMLTRVAMNPGDAVDTAKSMLRLLGKFTEMISRDFADAVDGVAEGKVDAWLKEQFTQEGMPDSLRDTPIGERIAAEITKGEKLQ